MALDEVLMGSANYDIPILRLYGWQPPAVSIGYFQSMDEEVDVKKCKQMGIDVVRRITGGGAVLHESELTYSFITRIYPTNIMESYNLLMDRRFFRRLHPWPRTGWASRAFAASL